MPECCGCDTLRCVDRPEIQQWGLKVLIDFPVLANIAVFFPVELASGVLLETVNYERLWKGAGRIKRGRCPVLGSECTSKVSVPVIMPVITAWTSVSSVSSLPASAL